MGESSEKQETVQHSETGPWKDAQPIMRDILGRAGGLMPSLGTTSQENNAFGMLRANAGNVPNYGPQAASLAGDMMNSPNYAGRINQGFDAFSNQLSPFLNPEYLDPTKTPGIASLLDTVRGDVSNNISGMFAGAGRDLSGAHMNALGRGITAAEAPILLGQYNQNVGNMLGAANALYGANNTTTGALSANDQQMFANRGQGLDIGVNGVPQAMNTPALNMLAAEDTIRRSPYQALGLPAALTLPIAGLGSVGDMTGTTTKTSQANPWQVGIGAALGLAGLMSGNPMMMMGGFGGATGGMR